MKINVLGTSYLLLESNSKKYPMLESTDGFCDNSVKLCVVDSYEDEPDEFTKRNREMQKNKNKRHELIHAFLFESGLAENSPWALNEELVDWFAMQFPKLAVAFEKAGCL